MAMTRLLSFQPGYAPDQRVAMVTGAAGAIGRAIVERLHLSGSAIVLVDSAGDAAEEVARAAGCVGATIEADLADTGSAANIMGIVEQHFGRLDQLINNAGLNRPQTIYAIEAEDWDAVMAVNLRAPMLLAHEAIRFWSKRPGGSIVNIGSRVWLSGAIPSYTASKAGLVGLTRSLAVELARLNVRVNAVAPSYIDTLFTRQTRSDSDIEERQKRMQAITPLPRLGTADDIASAVAFLASDEASFITGEVLHVCGGSQLAPQSNPFHSS